ncbi:DODA-type extradiol aromatic ring-opening family dioxygenase [Hazenella coriacea]|uniref:4,5-DOPA dioxygenase extradiol n=1 Tax=Hazenella coriacea TaxID=1179467 RepID=A0A4V2UV12_9BACL|nr:class III extradiol ring-cleavage dioxygenase [Hazenella coriacea]TCS93907.1 4,5-DOPA dioxygenase extradiol [Hazenella coriacea]
MVPSLFLAHGSPMLALEQDAYTTFLAHLGRSFQPKAIVIFTAHWESDTVTISSTDDVHDTIYDFYGFPDELYAINYPAKGSTQIAEKVKKRFQENGIPVQMNATRGLDHGSWTILSRLYPHAEIPVVQVSVNPSLSPREQLHIGQSLQGFGEEDILVIGSGVTVHNLGRLHWEQNTPESWAVEFDDWIIKQIEHGDIDTLFNYESLAPHANLAVPTKEHFVPLFITMGSGTQNKTKVIHRSYKYGTLSYLCFQF